MNGQALVRFRKVCGLLASDHAGERAAAALKATEMLRAAGESWSNFGAGPTEYAHANAIMMVQFYANALKSEQARTTDLIEENNRLKREVERLKGMWPKGRAA